MYFENSRSSRVSKLDFIFLFAFYRPRWQIQIRFSAYVVFAEETLIAPDLRLHQRAERAPLFDIIHTHFPTHLTFFKLGKDVNRRRTLCRVFLIAPHTDTFCIVLSPFVPRRLPRYPLRREDKSRFQPPSS